MTGRPRPRYLEEILAARRGRRRQRPPRGSRPDRPAFESTLAAAPRAIIAEVKVASPSRGPLIPAATTPEGLARAYETGGARAVSVVTEETRFAGSLELFARVRAATTLPLLRKDFLTTIEDVDESADWGASAILLIARILTSDQLAMLLEQAARAGLDALVEVHDESDVAVTRACSPTIIGVNNRDLQTFQVDLAVSEQLVSLLPQRSLKVVESGIATPADVDRLAAVGYEAFLVGESLVTSPDPAARLATLIGPARP